MISEPMRANAGDVYTVYNRHLGRYTACQVAYIAPPNAVSKQSWAVILPLDWSGDTPLEAEKLPLLRPLYMDFMYWTRDLHLLRVPVEVPPEYTLVGTLTPFTDQPCNSYGGWDDGYDVYLQIRWQGIPEDRRRKFKEAMESEEETTVGGRNIKVCSHRIFDDIPFDSALELEALPCLSEIVCERWHPDLLEFLRGNPFVDELTLLNHGQSSLDFRETGIRKLMLDMTGLEELWLGEWTEMLLFQNEGIDDCTIHAPGDGDRLTIQFIGEYRPHPELPGLWGTPWHQAEGLRSDWTGCCSSPSEGAASLGRSGQPEEPLRRGRVPGADSLVHVRPVRIRRGGHPYTGEDADSSLALDDQPARGRGEGRQACMEGLAGDGPEDHQAPEARVACPEPGQPIPRMGRCRTHTRDIREEGS